MSEAIKHECGIALIRLRKPLDYYHKKYGSWMYGLNKLYLLMEKQHNRGQDGAGIVSLKLNTKPGEKYINRIRSNDNMPIKEVFDVVRNDISSLKRSNPKELSDPFWAKQNIVHASEIYLGHLRYGTFGNSSIDYVHPVMRENNWKSRNLVMAGNFNLTNVDELFDVLVNFGQHPKDYSDTVTILEQVGHFIDEENQFLYRKYKNEGCSNKEISPLIENNLDITKVLSAASKDWDGGYAVAGILGYGDSFVARYPWGIRPAHYYIDDEVVVATSERPVIQTAFNVPIEKIHEIKPGYALIIGKDGKVSEQQIRIAQKRRSCSFERIYFSRGTDKNIYKERKKLGELLIPKILQTIDYDLENTVFSFIPNTAESAFLGMLKGLETYLAEDKKQQILKEKNLTPERLGEILGRKARVEKIAVKDVKLRTFITEDTSRDDMVAHVYDVTYGAVRDNIDNLVVIDDSIVRGTTLKQSILRILDRLNPKHIIIVSSAPQIRYTDCYGIDMAKLGDFAAFKATIELLKDQGKEKLIQDVYRKSKEQENLPKEQIVNYVKEIYKPFLADEISEKISQILTPEDISAKISIVYQSIENLHEACPIDKGDWYFTGDYPTAGGNKVVNTSFINYIEGKNKRAY